MADVMQPPKGGEPDTPEQKKPVPLVNDGLSPSDVDFIPPLVHSLVTLLRLRGKSVSTAFLMAGLAGTGRVSPGACLHAESVRGLRGRSFIGRAFRTFPRWCFRVSFCCPVTARAS